MSLDPERSLDLVFHALSDPIRRHMLQSLAAGDRRIAELAEPFGLTTAEVTRHVAALEHAELVRRLHPGGSNDALQLRMPPLKRAVRWMAFYEQFWSSQLEDLESLLARPSKDVPRDAGR